MTQSESFDAAEQKEEKKQEALQKERMEIDKEHNHSCERLEEYLATRDGRREAPEAEDVEINTVAEETFKQDVFYATQATPELKELSPRSIKMLIQVFQQAQRARAEAAPTQPKAKAKSTADAALAEAKAAGHSKAPPPIPKALAIADKPPRKKVYRSSSEGRSGAGDRHRSRSPKPGSD